MLWCQRKQTHHATHTVTHATQTQSSKQTTFITEKEAAVIKMNQTEPAVYFTTKSAQLCFNYYFKCNFMVFLDSVH